MTEEIIKVFEKYRMPSGQIDQFDIAGKMVLTEKIDSFIRNGKAIEFSMLGYPHKSMNYRDKVLGDIPDLGEQVSMDNFSDFAADIQKIYNEGIHLNIISDGYAFNDLMGVFDNTVRRYGEIVNDMSPRAVSNYSLLDFYPNAGRLNDIREKLDKQWGISEVELDRRILTDNDVQILYRGMIHFMEEDIAIRSYDSKNQLHKAAKKLARQMMLRNEAFSSLVQSEFSHAIRLSMHKSENNGKKFSFNLYPPGTQSFTSPWHSAIAIDEDGNMETIHKKDAILKGYDLIYKDGKPNHFLK